MFLVESLCRQREELEVLVQTIFEELLISGQYSGSV